MIGTGTIGTGIFLAGDSACAPCPQISTGRIDKISHSCGDLIGCRIQCEVTSVDNVDFSVRHILAVAFRLAGVEREFILAPDHQQSRQLLAHPGLPLGIIFDVRAVVVEEVNLNLALAGLVEKVKLIGP